jgi:hypothetical protein
MSFAERIETQSIEHMTATAICSLFTESTGEKAPSTKIGRPSLAQYCNSTNSHGTVRWTSKAAPAQQSPKPVKIDTKALTQSVVFELFNEHGYIDMVDIMSGNDDNTTIADLIADAIDKIENTLLELDCGDFDPQSREVLLHTTRPFGSGQPEGLTGKPVKMYHSKLIKYYKLWKGPAYEALMNYKRNQLLRFGAANIKRCLHLLETGRELIVDSFYRSYVREFLRGDIDTGVAELDTFRDQTKKRIDEMNEAIEEMRYDYRRQQLYVEQQARDKAVDQDRRRTELAAAQMAAMDAETELDAERWAAMEEDWPAELASAAELQVAE